MEPNEMTETKTRKKYTHSPAVMKELNFKRNLKKLLKMRRERAFYVTKIERIQAKLTRFDNRVKKVTASLIKA